MKSINYLMLRYMKRLIQFITFSICFFAASVRGQQIATPVMVGTSGVDGATLGIPRWKGYMSENSPDNFWLSYANSGSALSNISYTTDGGATWSSQVIQIDQTGWMDYHLSLYGMNGELYYTWPGSTNAICFRKFSSPAHGNNDRGPLISFQGTTNSYRSNIMLQNNGRIWVFTRLTGDANQNVRYQYSDNNGANWNSGLAFSTGYTDIRIGSMPYVNGNPALIVLYLGDNRGFQYYLWNDSAFEAKNDHTIYAVNLGQERAFTTNAINDTTMHIIFGQGINLHHCWKNYNSGSGAWTHQIIDTCPGNNLENDWYPISTVQGNDLYVFYCRKSGSDFSSSQVYYKKWSQSSQSWTPAVLVSGALTANRDPNTCFHVPANASYIPVFWNSGTGPQKVIYFSKIIHQPAPQDTIPPGRINDLGAVPGGPWQINLSWTASGDDGYEGGSVLYYEIRYSQSEISELTWEQAILFLNPPNPLEPGSFSTCTLSGLEAGIFYYIGIKAYDEMMHTSNLSNIAMFFAGGERQRETARSLISSPLIR